MKKDEELLAEFLREAIPTELQNRQHQVQIAANLNEVQQPEPAVGRLRVPEAQIPEGGGAPTNPEARLDPDDPRDVVDGGVMAPVVRATAPRGNGKRGPDKATTVRPPRKCKTCEQLGHSWHQVMNCTGRGGARYCPHKGTLDAMLALQAMQQS